MPKQNFNTNSGRTRTNTKLISSVSEPVYTSSTSSITQPLYSTTITSASNASIQGNSYSIRTNLTTISTNQYLAVKMANPSGSGKNVYLDQVSVFNSTTGVSGYVQADIYKITSTISGSLSPVNLNLASSNVSVFNNHYTVGTSSSSVAGTSLLTGVLGIQPDMLIFNLSGVIYIPQNTSVAVEVANQLNGALTGISIAAIVNITWWEI